MTQASGRHGWAAFGWLALLVSLNQMPNWFAGTPLARFAERTDASFRQAGAQREDLDALLAGYYEALVRKATHLSINSDFLQYKYQPNVVRATNPGKKVTNSFGLFDREYTREKPAGTRRLALIGDSISIGEFGNNFETMLEERLNRNHRTATVKNFEVLNLAVEGYKITQLVGVSWQRAPIFQPDVYCVTLTRLSVARRWSFHVGKLLQNGVDLQYDFLRQTVAKAGLRPTDSLSRMDRKLAPFHESVLDWSIAQFQAAAAHNQAKLVVILMPWTLPDPAIDEQFELARKDLTDLHVPFIDLRDSFAGETDMRQLRMSRDDYHPNARGHRIMADTLYSAILADRELSETILGYVPGELQVRRAPALQAKNASTF
jgi:hypothetical protein